MVYYTKRSFSKSWNPYWGKSSGTNKRSKGQFKAAKEQRDTSNFVVKGTYAFPVTYKQSFKINDAGNDEMQDNINFAKNIGNAAINFYEVLSQNTNFQAMKKMYDQVKINAINCKLTITNYTNPTGTDTVGNAIQCINVVTAWDRTGLSDDQICPLKDTPTEGHLTDHQVIQAAAYNTEKVTSYFVKLGGAIGEYNSSDKSIVNNYQKWTKKLSLYAKDAAEKQSYVSCDNIDSQLDKINALYNCLYLVKTNYAKTFIDMERDVNPTQPLENPVLQWKPTLLIGCFLNDIDGTSGKVNQFSSFPYNLIFNMEYSIDCTFRAMKGTL